jgi:type IV fimbrial biogenesis protein FimT
MSNNNHIRHSGRAGRERGLSIIELMLTVAIVALLAAMATPSFTIVVQNNRIRTQSSDLMSNLAIARAEAAKRNVRVTLCASTTWQNTNPTCTGGGSTAWNLGYILFADVNGDGNFDAGTDSVIAVAEPLTGGNSLGLPGGNSLQSNNFTAPAAADKFQYRPSGATNLPAVGGTFKLCDVRTGSAGKQVGRLITINVTGRTSSVFVDCP